MQRATADRQTPPTGQRNQVRSLVSRRLRYFFLSVSVSVSWCATATKTATVSLKKMLFPYPCQHPGRCSWLVWCNEPAVIHSYCPFSSHRTAAPSALCSSSAMTRQGDGWAFTQTCSVKSATVNPRGTGRHTHMYFQNNNKIVQHPKNR